MSKGPDQIPFVYDGFLVLMNSFLKRINVNIFIFNSEELFDRMRDGHTKTSSQIDVLDDSILSEFLYVCLFFYKKIHARQKILSDLEIIEPRYQLCLTLLIYAIKQRKAPSIAIYF